MSLEELEEKVRPKKVEAEQGALTYVSKSRSNNGKSIIWPEEGKRDRVKGKRKDKSSALKLILPIFVSVVLAALMVYQFAPNKAEFNSLAASSEGVQNSVASVVQGLTYEAGRVDNIVTKMGTYALRTELTGYVSDGELASLRTEIEILNGYIDSLESRIIWLETNGGE